MQNDDNVQLFKYPMFGQQKERSSLNTPCVCVNFAASSAKQTIVTKSHVCSQYNGIGRQPCVAPSALLVCISSFISVFRAVVIRSMCTDSIEVLSRIDFTRSKMKFINISAGSSLNVVQVGEWGAEVVLSCTNAQILEIWEHFWSHQYFHHPISILFRGSIYWYHK